MTSTAEARTNFAAIMQFPLSSGFSVGQAGATQVAGWGIGMARTLYVLQRRPGDWAPTRWLISLIRYPGTRTIVLGLIEDELCRSLINQATAKKGTPGCCQQRQAGDVVTYAYSMAAGNGTGSPTCGSVFVSPTPPPRQPSTRKRRHSRHGDLAAVDPRRHRQFAEAPDRLHRPVLLAEQDLSDAVTASRPLLERNPRATRSS